MSRYVVKLTMQDAKELGIVVCENCGYPPNNHWSERPVKERDFTSACAHAPCPGYKPKFRRGRPIHRSKK